jgi:hypothetical protein
MEKRNLTFYEVIDGHWSSAGNFLGVTADDEVIHIYGKQMEIFNYLPLNHSSNDSSLHQVDIKFPLYVLAYEKKFINANDENANRLTAASIWDSYKTLIDTLLLQMQMNDLD